MTDEKQNLENGLELSITANGKEEHKTETEQLYDDMTSKNEAEEKEEQETEETTEQEEEEILSEEELEIQREIEPYQSKIETLDAKLAAHEAQHIDALRREQMKARYYSEEQIDRYIEYIDGTSKDEIIESIDQLQIPPANDNFADPSPCNGRAAKPKTVDHTEIGRQAFGRIKHKIFPWMR